MALSVGGNIGDYEVVSKLRAGGMATLYIARRSGAAGFARTVALKIVHPHLSQDPEFVDMFIDEAKVSSRIQHPNVVHVESFGQHQGDYYLVMEFVHGCSLGQLNRELLERNLRLSRPLAVYIAIKVLDGLHAAHEALGSQGENLGVVHRDVTPSNILLSYRGPIKLIDFGVAKAQGRIQQTGAGQIKGKFAYMSPEQANGQEVDRRTDLYAVAVLLWEMITGERYNLGDTPMQSLAMARTPTGMRASQFVEDLSPALDEALARGMNEDADERPASAREFRRELAKACPEALSIDDQDVSDFVVSVMQGQLEAELAQMPSEVSGLFGQDSGEHLTHTDAERLLKTHTVSVPSASGTAVTQAEVSSSVRTVSSVSERESAARENTSASGRRNALVMVVILVIVGGIWAGLSVGGDQAANRAQPERAQEPAATPQSEPVDMVTRPVGEDLVVQEPEEPRGNTDQAPPEEDDDTLAAGEVEAVSQAPDARPARPAGPASPVGVRGTPMNRVRMTQPSPESPPEVTPPRMNSGLREVGMTRIIQSPGF